MEVNDTLKSRGDRYGSFEDNSRICQELILVIKSAPSFDKLDNAHLEAIHMIFHKISRMVCGDPDYADNAHDIAGYAMLLETYLNAKN
jgi:hypothetical protein